MVRAKQAHLPGESMGNGKTQAALSGPSHEFFFIMWVGFRGTSLFYPSCQDRAFGNDGLAAVSRVFVWLRLPHTHNVCVDF